MANMKPLGKLSFEDKDLLKKTYADFEVNFEHCQLAHDFIGGSELYIAKLSPGIDWPAFTAKFLKNSQHELDNWFSEFLGNINQVMLSESTVGIDVDNDILIMFKSSQPDEELIGELTDLEKKVYIAAYKQFYKKRPPFKGSSVEDRSKDQLAETYWHLKVNFFFMFCRCLVYNRLELQFPEFQEFAIRDDFQIWGKPK